jgi:hypothetical protein
MIYEMMPGIKKPPTLADAQAGGFKIHSP